MNRVLKYRLYEETVQSPKWQVDYLPQFHEWLLKKKPRKFREDFCGTARISCEWVKKSPKNSACGLDLDPEPLSYAREINLSALPLSARNRIKLLQQDVLKPTRERFDMIGAFNFSFFDFHERKTLLAYARAALKSLEPEGTLFLECAGGDGFLAEHQESTTVRINQFGKVKMVWEQHQYDPITHLNDYSIHFQLPDRSWINDAFTYHWRIWGIRELREVLLEAGFSKTYVLWNQEQNPTETDNEFIPTENADHHLSWIAYVIGLKEQKKRK